MGITRLDTHAQIYVGYAMYEYIHCYDYVNGNGNSLCSIFVKRHEMHGRSIDWTKIKCSHSRDYFVWV